MGERNYYMVRIANTDEKVYQHLLAKEAVAIGWSDVNLSQQLDKEISEVADIVRENYYPKTREIAPQVVGKKLNEIKRFLRIKKDDIILIPYGSSVRIAKAKGTIFYDNDLKDKDLGNCAGVYYLSVGTNQYLTIPRKELTEGLQRRLRVRGSTVSDLYEFGAEIENLINSETHDFDTEYNASLEAQVETFKSELLNNICCGRTHLQAGGTGLEELIKELLECEGYTARIRAKQETEGKGDIDITAERTTFFSEEHIAVQAKHHSGITDDWGIQQLIYAMNTEVQNYTYVFITSADISPKDRKKAEQADIRVMDGKALVDWIYENIEKLSDKTIRQLGISMVPQTV